MATAEDVAQWMVDQLSKTQRLYQSTAAQRIRLEFGIEFTYRNKNGNWAIRKDVLAAFNKLTGDSVVWNRGSRVWRKRREHDKPGRQQN